MRIFNKGHRDFIINRKDAIEGCFLPKDPIAEDKAYIKADTEVEVSDSVGEKLLRDYPKELMKIGRGYFPKDKKTSRKKAKSIKE